MNILNIFKKEKQVTKQNLPFVRVIGFEKTYGQARPDDFDSMIDNYKSWAYSCANRNAYSIAKCQLKIYKKGTILNAGKKSAELTELDNHPFIELMQKVNPFFNRFELLTLLGIYLELTGNAYWWIVKNQLGVPTEIWNIPSNWMKIIPSQKEFISGYVMKSPQMAEEVPFLQEDIIHFKYPSPFSLYYGASPLLAAQYGIDLNNHSKIYGINFLMNNAQPSGALTTEDSLTPEQFKRLADMWNQRHRGSENAGKVAVLEKGLKYNPIGQGLGELNFPEMSRTIRDEILSCFGVPASKLGLVEDVNRANAEANDYTYQKETILPKLTLIEEKLNEKLMPMYSENLIVKFDNPVPDDKDFRLREIAEHIRTGYSAIDDERIKDKLDPYETPETSMPLISFGVIPAGTPKPEPTMNTGDEDVNGENDNDSDDKEDNDMASGDDESDDEEDNEQDKPKKPKPIKPKKAINKARADRKWEVFVKMISPIEKLMAKSLERYFKAQREDIVRHLNNSKALTKDFKAMNDNVLLNKNEQDQKLKILLAMFVRQGLISGAELEAEELNVRFNEKNPALDKAVEQRLNDLALMVNGTTWKLLNEAINEAVSKGEPMSSIVDKINSIYDLNENTRSKRIALTEIVGAANYGMLFIMIASGKKTKEWITARDERVRDSHKVLDGVEIPVEEDFTTGLGNRMRFPGDRNSCDDASDLINCRCTLQ